MQKRSFTFALITSFLVTLLVSCSNDSARTNESFNSQAVSANSISVLFDTSLGQFKVALNTDKAPITVANFLQYVDDGFYNGTIFHRVIGNFMVQGGGFTPDMQRKQTRAAIVNEADNGLPNVIGSIAMARLPYPDSATSQFFINVADNASLNHRDKSPAGWGYAVFGHVTDGMDVVNTIRTVKTAMAGNHGDVPIQPVIINSVTRI